MRSRPVILKSLSGKGRLSDVQWYDLPFDMSKRHSILLLALLAGPIHAGIITPVGVTSSIAGDAGSSVDFLLSDNGSLAPAGLQDADGAAATLAAGDPLSKVVGTFAYRSGDGHQESWTNPTSGGNPVFVFDLSGGGDLSVGSAALWQYGNNGGPGLKDGGNSTREFRVIFHTEAEGSTFDFTTESADITGTMEAIDGNATTDNKAQIYFAGASHTARYAAIRIDSNYGGQPGYGGGDRYGLGEVRFATEASRDPHFVPPTAAVTGSTAGAPITLNIPIINQSGTSSLEISAATLAGIDPDYFSITSTLPLIVPPGSTVDLKVDFDPETLTGAFNAELQLTSNDTLLPTATVNLSVAVASPEISAAAPGVYGPVANGAGLQTFSVPVSNTGTGPLAIFDADFVPGATDTGLFEDFAVVHDFGVEGLTVEPSGQVNLEFTFDPTGLKGGLYPATLRIMSDDADEGSLDIPLFVEVSLTGGSSLVAWWPMEGDADDASGNGHHGAATAVTYTAGANAATGKAGDFDGISSKIDVSFNEALNPSSFTLTAWAFADSATGVHSVVTSRNDSVNVNGLNYGYILYDIGGKWEFWTGSGSGLGSQFWDITSGPAVTAGQWVHLALVYDHVAKTKTLYVNGVVAATSSDVSFGRNLLENLHIGSGDDAGANFYFDGKIDDVAIFRAALSQTDINTVLTTGVTGFTGLPQPVDSQIGITGVSVTGGNIVIAGATGLTTGAEYHLETGINLDDFVAVPGSNFTGGDPIPVVPADGPRRFVRIAEGPVPGP